MTYKRETLPAFAVIGMEGSTADGPDFIARLWDAANSRFGEIGNLAVMTEAGFPAGVWGLMSDMSESFAPWQNGFSEGLYLAGAQCPMDAEAPAGWTKWVSPAYEYIVTENGEGAFSRAIEYLASQGLTLAGAAYDRTDLATGKGFIYLPIKRL